DQVVDLRGGVAGVEEHQHGRVIGRGDRACVRCRHHDLPVLVWGVDVALEHDQVFVAVSGEVHDVRTELCDPIQQISGGRGGPYVEVDEIAVQGRLHGGANTFLLPPDPQLTVGGGPEQQDTLLLRLRRPYRSDDIVHGC